MTSLRLRPIQPSRWAAFLALAGLTACGQPRNETDPLADPGYSLYALVETIDGTSFGPPLGPEIAAAGSFDATLLARLQVVLEASDQAGHVQALATFSATSLPRLTLLAPHELYWMNVPAAAYFTDPALAYRFRALLDGREIGRSDMSSKVFEVMRYVPTLPVGVKLRIEARPAPALAGIYPTTLVAGSSDFTLTVTGSAFARDSLVRFGGQDLATTRVSATELTAVVPATLITSSGASSVTVVTPAPGGGTSAAASFVAANPQPTLTALSPAVVLLGSADLTLTLTGSSFVAGAHATFAGTPLATTYAAADRLLATLPAALLATAGVRAVTVVNPDPGGASGALELTVENPSPAITALSPDAVPAGRGALTLTIDGASFVAGAQALVGGTALTTTFVSATRLLAAVPADRLAAAGPLSITVANAAPAVGPSASATFTVSAPTCTDGVRNGAESAIDCGGSCARCATGLTCGAGSDCQSGICQAGLCAPASCNLPWGGALLEASAPVTAYTTASASDCAAARISLACNASSQLVNAATNAVVNNPSQSCSTSDPYASNTIALLKFEDFTDTEGASLTNSGLTLSTSPAKYGRSGAFSGTNYIYTTNGSTSYAISSLSAFTIEAWVYPTALSGLNALVHTAEWGLYTNGGRISWVTQNVALVSDTVALPLNTWTHVAAMRSGGRVYLYVDGVLRANAAIGLSGVGTGSLYVGYQPGYGRNWRGYLDDVRITNTTRYSLSGFTPPGDAPVTTCALPWGGYVTQGGPTVAAYTAASAADCGAVAVNLTCSAASQLVDATTRAVVTSPSLACSDAYWGNVVSLFRFDDLTDAKGAPMTNNGVTLSTSPTKFGRSGYFDGSTYFYTSSGSASYSLGSQSAFTIEAWVYPTSFAGNNAIVHTNEWGLFTSNGALAWVTQYVAVVADTTALPLNTWTHVAAMRSAGVVRIYVNGVLRGSGPVGLSGVGTGPMYIGFQPTWNRTWHGYLDDVRITNVARYNLTGFAAPAEAPTR